VIRPLGFRAITEVNRSFVKLLSPKRFILLRKPLFPKLNSVKDFFGTKRLSAWRREQKKCKDIQDTSRQTPFLAQLTANFVRRRRRSRLFVPLKVSSLKSQ